MNKPLLSAIGFNLMEQQGIMKFCQENEMALERMMHYAVIHYIDTCNSIAELGDEPACLGDQAPSFTKPESNFKPEENQ